jgi:hypothetical protein
MPPTAVQARREVHDTLDSVVDRWGRSGSSDATEGPVPSLGEGLIAASRAIRAKRAVVGQMSDAAVGVPTTATAECRILGEAAGAFAVGAYKPSQGWRPSPNA